MEGWRQGRPGSNAKPTGKKRKTDLTQTGLLMEGLGRLEPSWDMALIASVQNLVDTPSRDDA